MICSSPRARNGTSLHFNSMRPEMDLEILGITKNIGTVYDWSYEY